MVKSVDIRKGVIALVILAATTALMGVFARYLSTGFTIFQQVYLRVFAGFMISLIIFRSDLDFKKFKKIPFKEWVLLSLRSIAIYALGVCVFSQAVLETKLGNVSFIASLPLVALFGFLFFREKVTVPKILLIILSLIGAAVLVIKDFGQLLSWGHGEILALISASGFAFGFAARKWHTQLLNNKELTVLTFLVGGVFILLLSLLNSESIPLVWNWGLLSVVLIAGANNVIYIFLSNYGFERVNNVLAGNILTLESVFGVSLGLFYGEFLSIREFMGGALIVASVIAMNQYSKRESKTA